MISSNYRSLHSSVRTSIQ